MTDFPQIPGYRIENELGHGGMAVVYLAHEEKLDRQVALKVLELLSAQGRDLAERFIREARTAARLQQSNIVSIFDVGRAGNLYYMAVEYLPGGTLRDLLRSGLMGPTEALRTVERLASGLSYAHSQGFIHRDVKPENIMFRRDGTPVITDFGIARAVGGATKLTKTGMSIGTPHYMSPEQARGLELDGRADIYSLGIVLYEMLTGKVPYESEDSVALAIKHIQEPIPQLPPRLRDFQPLIDRIMAKDREKRVQTGDELIKLINGIEPESPGAKARSPKPSSRGTKEQPRDRKTPLGIDFGAAYKKKDEAGRGAGKMPGEAHERRSSSRTLLVGVLSVALVAGIALLIILLNKGGGERIVVKATPISVSPSSPEAKEPGRTPSSFGASEKNTMSSNEKGKEKQDQSRAKEFIDYVTKARQAYFVGDFGAAERQLDLAESIKPGDKEIVRLKEVIRGGIKAEKDGMGATEAGKQVQATEEDPARQDDAAYEKAISENTVLAFQFYIMNYPAGKHVSDANSRILKLSFEEQDRKANANEDNNINLSQESKPDNRSNWYLDLRAIKTNSLREEIPGVYLNSNGIQRANGYPIVTWKEIKKVSRIKTSFMGEDFIDLLLNNDVEIKLIGFNDNGAADTIIEYWNRYK